MSSFSRRALLVGSLTALTTGCATGFPSLPDAGGLGRDPQEPGPQPRDPGAYSNPDSLVRFSTLGGATLGYEIGRTPTSFRADPRFVELLEAWAQDWSALSGLGAMTTLWSYGAYVDKESSLHASGRAFDIAEVEHEQGSVSCRYDVWGPGSATQIRDYWRLAASLHAHFSYTLTHLYNRAHHNHIHVDNARSQWDPPTFRSRSRTQVRIVQSALRHVFGADVEVNGEWNSPTRDSLRTIQASLGITRPVSDADGWREFLRGTASAA